MENFISNFFSFYIITNRCWRRMHDFEMTCNPWLAWTRSEETCSVGHGWLLCHIHASVWHLLGLKFILGIYMINNPRKNIRWSTLNWTENLLNWIHKIRVHKKYCESHQFYSRILIRLNNFYTRLQQSLGHNTVKYIRYIVHTVVGVVVRVLGTLINTSSAGTGSNPTIGIQSSIVAVNFYRTLIVR
jgi:hypothetical protein